jgi:hypothetical protein
MIASATVTIVDLVKVEGFVFRYRKREKAPVTDEESEENVCSDAVRIKSEKTNK